MSSQRREASVTEYSEKLAAAQSARESLERDLVNLHTQLDQERGQRTHQTDLVAQADAKVQALQAKVGGYFAYLCLDLG